MSVIRLEAFRGDNRLLDCVLKPGDQTRFEKFRMGLSEEGTVVTMPQGPVKIAVSENAWAGIQGGKEIKIYVPNKPGEFTEMSFGNERWRISS
jgi:hypothetical protein